MNIDQNIAVYAIISTIIISFVYYFILVKLKANETFRTEKQLITSYLLRKISGFMLFGLIPALLCWALFQIDFSEMGLASANKSGIWLWTTGFSVFFILLNLYNSRSAQLRAVYPELRLKVWTPVRLIFATTGWMVYLAGYEFLFRGLLLFSTFHAFGYWPAIAINLILYAAQHLPKGMKETAVTIPFGALLCYLTIESQSILPAIIIHSIQAISCEILCIYRNHEMQFNYSKNNKI